MSAYGKRILLVLVGFGLVAGAFAQDRRLSEAELAKLKIWYALPQPSGRGGGSGMYQLTSYQTIRQLVDSVNKQEPVQSLQISSGVLKKGNVERLVELKNLRVLHLEIDSTTATTALWQTLGQLKQLQWLSVIQYANQTIDRHLSAEWTTALSNLAQLEQLQLNIKLADWKPTFRTLARLPELRRLFFSVNVNATIPPELGQLRQLTALTIQGGGTELAQLPASLGDLTNLKDLNLNYLKIDQKVAWSVLSKLTELETLHFQFSELPTLPDLRTLTKLRTLWIQGNGPVSIKDDAFDGLASLEKISLSNCHLKQWPRSLTRLQGLKELNLADNPVGELPDEIGSLQQLEVLEAHGCQLRTLPKSLQQLTRLKKLNLGTNQLDTLGFDLGQLTALTSLMLFGNQLQELPASLGRLTGLQQLNLINNQLRELPETLGNLTNLTYLSLVGNQLTGLPKSLGRLTKLGNLELTGNQLRQLPTGLNQLRRLKHLYLGSNKLAQLPDDLGGLDSLSSLDVSRNELTALPSGIFSLPQLKSLNVNQNKLSALPTGLGKLTNLNRLDVSANRLTSLPNDLGNLTQLEHLQCWSNPLETLPETIGQCRELQTLYAQNTKLKVLPASIGRLIHIRELYLSGNELTVLPEGLGNLTELTSLMLGKTRLMALPESIGRLTKLSTLNIGNLEDIAVAQGAGLQQLPDSLVYCTALSNVNLVNQTELDGEDAFRKLSQLPALRMLSLAHCNLERIPVLDWKKWPVYQLNLFQNRLTEVPVEMLEAPNLQYVTLSENLLPETFNKNFATKDALRLAFAEAGLLALDKIAKPNRGIATVFAQTAFQKAGQRNWTEAFANFEKAIDYASDTMRIALFAQRGDMHAFRKEFAEAVADYSQSIQLADRFLKGVAPDQPMQTLQFAQPAVLALRGRANAKAKQGQVDAALADIESAISRYANLRGNSEISGSLWIEQGRYLTLKNKVSEANASYQKAIEEYRKAPYANIGIKLTLVELYLLVGQPDEAGKALQLINKRDLTRGNATLENYLESCIQVLKHEKPDAEIVAVFNQYLASHSDPVLGWSFELFENWLPRSGLPTEKQAVLQQLTQLTKERVPKID